MSILVLWQNIFEDALFGRVSDVDADELVLRSILIGKEVERCAVVGNARDLLKLLLGFRFAWRENILVVSRIKLINELVPLEIRSNSLAFEIRDPEQVFLIKPKIQS